MLSIFWICSTSILFLLFSLTDTGEYNYSCIYKYPLNSILDHYLIMLKLFGNSRRGGLATLGMRFANQLRSSTPLRYYPSIYQFKFLLINLEDIFLIC